MNVAQFANELTQLIIRWTTPRMEDVGESPEPESWKHVPLTKQEIFNTMENVVQIVWGDDERLAISSSLKTPASGIAMCTPNAPVVPKPEPAQFNAPFGRFRSMETLAVESRNLDSLTTDAKSEGESEPGPENVLPENKKFISVSSPAISISIPRSDTFIRQENANSKKDNGQENSDDVFEKAEKEFAAGMSREFLQKLEALSIAAIEVLKEIDDVAKDSNMQAGKPIHRLSSIGTLQRMNRASALSRAAPPTNPRRSSGGFVGTPTSSKQNTTTTTQKGQVPGRRKTMSAAMIHLTTSSVNTPSSRPAPYPPSTSPGQKGTLKSVKKSKYAHVQSTIPKLASVVKKSQ